MATDISEQKYCIPLHYYYNTITVLHSCYIILPQISCKWKDYFMKHLAYFNHKRAVFIKQNNSLEPFMELHDTGFRNTFMTVWVTAQKVTSNTTQN